MSRLRSIWLTLSRVELGFQVALPSLSAFLYQMPLNLTSSMSVSATQSTSTLVDESSIVRDSVVLNGGTLISLPHTVVRPAQPRRPHLGNSFAPSPFHPLVLAQDHLQCWSTPFSLVHIASLRTKLGDYAAHHSIATLLISVEPKTCEVYSAGLLCFTQYCDTFDVSESDRMPASDVLLGAFASSGAAKVA